MPHQQQPVLGPGRQVRPAGVGAAGKRPRVRRLPGHHAPRHPHPGADRRSFQHARPAYVCGLYRPNPADIATHADEHTTVLCTRVSDALAVNRDVLQRLSRDGKVGPVYPTTITHDVHDLHAFRALEEAWLRKPKFRKLEYVAVGAKVRLTENIHVASGFANGAAAVVEELRLGTDERGQARVDGIHVRLESNGRVRTLTRSTKRTIYENGVRYTKATFPLALAYAITAHCSQVSMCTFLAHAHAPRQHAVGPGCMRGILSCCFPGKKDEQHVACGGGTTGTDHAHSTLCRLAASQPPGGGGRKFRK